MATKTYAMAIRDTIAEEMRRDGRVFIMGEDIEILGGIFGCTRDLYKEFGTERVRNTPISEAGIIGAGVGAACAGMRPLANPGWQICRRVSPHNNRRTGCTDAEEGGSGASVHCDMRHAWIAWGVAFSRWRQPGGVNQVAFAWAVHHTAALPADAAGFNMSMWGMPSSS